MAHTRRISSLQKQELMRKSTIMAAMVAALTATSHANAQTPASVYLTAGQSNADGREYVSKLPSYMRQGYQRLRYANVTSSCDGTFGARTFDDNSSRFAFCDVTNYFIDQASTTVFYSIKCAYGGTAIDTAATYAHLPVWCADPTWIAANNAYRGDISTGKSLTKSLTEGLADCANATLSKLQQGYDVKAIMWHQGESDRKQSGHYYKNFKDMINYMRNAIYETTGREKDKTLPFIFGTVSHNSKQYNSAVEKAQKQVAEELPNVYYIDMSDAGLRSDALHFDSAWTEYLGKMMYNKLVELNLVDNGKAIDVCKPKTDEATDTLRVEAERSWDFTKAWGDDEAALLAADEKWPSFKSLGYRYSAAMATQQELSTSAGHVFTATKGLYFKCSSGNRIIINPGKYLCFYGDNLYLTIPKVSPGQTVTIVTESAKGERGLTTDSGDLLELLNGGTKSTDKVTNSWRVKETLTEPVDLVFHSNGGAIYVYSIDITSPCVQILVGADQNVTFSSDKACDVKPHANLIKAYVATSYDTANHAVVLERVDTIPANTGVVVIGEESLVGAKVVECKKQYAANLLVPMVNGGDIAPAETANGVACTNYTLKAVDGQVDFHKLTTSTTMAAGTAYLRLPTATAANADTVKANANNDASCIDVMNLSRKHRGQWFTLNGTSIAKPTEGLYVCDGQKYLLK